MQSLAGKCDDDKKKHRKRITQMTSDYGIKQGRIYILGIAYKHT